MEDDDLTPEEIKEWRVKFEELAKDMIAAGVGGVDVWEKKVSKALLIEEAKGIGKES